MMLRRETRNVSTSAGWIKGQSLLFFLVGAPHASGAPRGIRHSTTRRHFLRPPGNATVGPSPRSLTTPKAERGDAGVVRSGPVESPPKQNGSPTPLGGCSRSWMEVPSLFTLGKRRDPSSRLTLLGQFDPLLLGGHPQLAEGSRFDLPDPFLGDAHLGSNLFQRSRLGPVAQPKAADDDLLLALVQPR